MSVEAAPTRLRHQVPLVLWLVLVWILLWGTWSWANVISGLVVALVVLVLLPLPHVVGGVRLRPLAVLAFFGHFAGDVAVSGAQVAWLALRPRRADGGSAIVRVQLRTDSDLLLTMVAEATSLVPGSLVLDLDREARVMTVHLLHVRDEAAIEQERADVLRTEERLVRAFGAAADVAALSAAAGTSSGERVP